MPESGIDPEPIAGDMHFDDDESWHIGADMDLFSVALHEAGHALGLGHSDNPSDVMYAYYRRATTLAAGDIAAIRLMYAPNTGSNPQPPAQPPATPPATPPQTPSNPAPPSPKDSVAPSIAVSSPAAAVSTTSASSIVVKGAAQDNVGVTRVTYSVSWGLSGTASGTVSWTTPAIPLLPGSNTITVRAYDAAGNSAWRSVTVTRR